MCPAAIGTQTVGSVGRPASFNGLASIVPTQRRVSRSGAFPLAWSLDHVGAFTRSIADLELITDALCDSPVERFPAPLRLRLGVIRGFFTENIDSESRALYEALVGNLVSAGVSVDEARLPSAFDLSPSILRTLLRSEAASIHGRFFAHDPNMYGPKLRELIETGELVGSQDYLHARRVRRVYQREMQGLFRNFDVLMTPAARGAAPEGLDTTGDPMMNAPWTLADFPTVTVPYALTVSGMPLAVQISGPPMQEGLLLHAARRVEEIAEFRAAPDLAF
jgi:aspartyl-tRNA(Asn)/glutamyl-tRNA(Gln) amidotransferase subunit A